MAETKQEAKLNTTSDVVKEAEQMSSTPRESAIKSDSDDSSDLPPHERNVVTRVPVTPGIQPSTYSSQVNIESTKAASPSYFNQNDNNVSKESATGPAIDASSPTNLVQGASSDHEVLRRMSISLSGRRESITEIKAAAPDLALSGNIISATFTTPHSLKYHKSGDWVSIVLPLL